MAKIELKPVAPAEAIRFFRSKGLAPSYAWQDVFQEDHAKAFTVAKGMHVDVLQDIRDGLDRAIADGTTLDQFRAELKPLLQAKGWWGKKRMMDPKTGELETVQLGSPRRLRTIFDVNVRSAYSAGKWVEAQRVKDAMPYLRYVAVMDSRTRPDHRAWHGTILPIDHPWWNTHTPPCGWNCRCTFTQLNLRTIERRGWTVTEDPPKQPPIPYKNPRTGQTIRIEGGIDPGFSFNVGKAYLDGVTPAPAMPSAVGPQPLGQAGAVAEKSVAAFLDQFGLGNHGSKVFTDDDGWPMPIGRSLFLDPAGRADGVPAHPATARAIADTLLQPAVMDWTWTSLRPGLPVTLARRYRRAGVTVEVAPRAWRWSLDGAEGFVERAMAEGGAPQPQLRLGQLHAAIADKVAGLSIDAAGKAIALDHSLARHIVLSHGGDGEADRGQVPVTGADVARAAELLNAAERIAAPKRARPVGPQRFEADAISAGVRYLMVFEVRRDAVVLVSMFKRRVK